MKTIERRKDIIFGDNDLEDLYSLKGFPIFMGCTDQSYEDDLFADQTWQISKSNGVIQLKELIPLNILYKNSHDSGLVGAKWLKHHEEFGDFVLKNSPKNILEIGGAHGILSKKCMDKEKLNWTIIEPNPSPVKNCKANFIKGFFDDEFELKESIDTIVHSHVLEHIYNPVEFMKNTSNFLQTGQKLIFSIPNMEVMLRNKYSNCINFEHTYFLTEDIADYLLTSNGFSIKNKQYFENDHSIFYSCVKTKNTKESEIPLGSYNINKNIFIQFIDYHKKIVNELNQEINQYQQNVFLFGAHIFSQYLLEFGLDSKKIINILDNDKNKHNRRLYGTKVIVKSPQILKDIKKPIVILKAGTYNQEIKNDILQNINSSTIFL